MSSQKEKYKITIVNFFRHLHLINRHRFKVFCLCVRAGQIWRGLTHDLSKYSPSEFFEGVKYFAGDYSPISNCKRDIGYSPAWLHHIGKNKHHYEYWYDYNAPIESPIIPYKYFVEMVCDSLAAGMIYQKKRWTKDYQLNYWLKTREKAKIHPQMDLLLTRVYTDVGKYGVNKVVNKKYLSSLYNKYMR